MKNYFPLFILILFFSCQQKRSVIRDHLSIEINVYEDGDRTKASAMPILKGEKELMTYKRRFDYLLMNIPEIHGANKFKERDSLNSLYPDTLKIKQLYLDLYCKDQNLTNYFDQTFLAIKEPGFQKTSYTSDELMNVASKFFYCDQVNPDTSVQMHICIGINGLKENKWKKDYTLLAAFCFEAIFNDLDKDDSQIRTAYSSEHEEAGREHKKTSQHLTSI